MVAARLILSSVFALALFSAKCVVVSSGSICLPSDFERVSQQCDESSGTRKITFVQRRNCSGGYQAPDLYKESCACTPQDYVADYSYQGPNNTCHLSYIPKNCTGGNKTDAGVVDAIYCASEQVACTEENIQSTYLSCDLTSNEVEVVYYFNDKCNPEAANSVRLPPNVFIPCNLHCGAGSHLVGQSCQLCPNGTFSIGGGIRLEGLTSLDSSFFQTSCSFRKGNNKTSSCTPWIVQGGSLKAGPYDQPNEFFQDECGVANRTCHNDLKSILSTSVKLVRDGSVSFEFTVNSERNYDGLSFYIDQIGDSPALPLTSFETELTQKNFSLSAGYHTLTWIYSKDPKWTQGKDSATITWVEIDGTDFNDQDCTPCPLGTYSARGSSACLPCPANFFSNTTGASECTPCPAGFYSATDPKTNCTAKPACDASKDATSDLGPCHKDSHTQTKTFSWLQPQICQPISDSQLPAPRDLPCTPCPAGQVFVSNGTGYLACALCPAGQARSDTEESCHACPAGQAAVRELTLAHFPTTSGSLPDGFLTGCSGQCGTNGWRIVNGDLMSGTGHGNTVSIWLALNVTLEMDGQVSFNYSADIEEDDTQRGFFFYIDDDLTDDYEVADDATEITPSGPWPLTAGNHTLVWQYIKINADPSFSTTDQAAIIAISIEGEVRGGAKWCQRVPVGTEALPNGNAWKDCPAGTYGTGGTATCQPCPGSTYNPTPRGSLSSCLPCPAGTSSAGNSTECIFGDAYNPSSFCTYTPPQEYQHNDTTIQELTIFDLSPLNRLHPGSMFGPVYENASSPTREKDPIYFFNVCQKITDNHTCVGYDGSSLHTYGCRAWDGTPVDGDVKPSHSLGDILSITPLSNDTRLLRRGLQLSLTGSRCPFREGPRRSNITFVCDPSSGYGAPESWTSEGLRTVFDPSATFPWVNRGGQAMSVEGNYCEYSFVWYTLFACPLCGAQDFEEVPVSGCVDNKRVKYQYKDPKSCQPSILSPLPEDIPCDACREEDYEEAVESCVDKDNKYNTTYRWKQPQICNPELAASVQLPADIIVGPCYQNVTIYAGLRLTLLQKAGLTLGGLAIIALAGVSVVLYFRSRRIYSEYTKLLNSEKPGDFAMEPGTLNDSDESDDAQLREPGSEISVRV